MEARNTGLAGDVELQALTAEGLEQAVDEENSDSPITTYTKLQRFFSFSPTQYYSPLPPLSPDNTTNRPLSDSAVILSKEERVRRAARASLAESMVSLGFSGLAVYFMEANSSWIRNPLLVTTFSLLINFLLRIPNPSNKWMQFALRSLRSIVYSSIDQRTRDAIWHEFGHVCAFLLLYNKSDPSVTIIPSFFSAGGNTHSSHSKTLSEFGAALGFENSQLATSMAGTGASMAWNYAGLILSTTLLGNHPEIKSHLRFSIAISVLKSIEYALSPYYLDCDKNKSNDFCRMDESGISPTYAILFIVGSILLLQLFLSLSKWICTPRNVAHSEDDYERPTPAARF